MWGPLSKSDERWYRRQAEKKRTRQAWLEAMQTDLPRRIKILARVKAGEISLEEGQRLIRAGYQPDTKDEP